MNTTQVMEKKPSTFAKMANELEDMLNSNDCHEMMQALAEADFWLSCLPPKELQGEAR